MADSKLVVLFRSTGRADLTLEIAGKPIVSTDDSTVMVYDEVEGDRTFLGRFPLDAIDGVISAEKTNYPGG